MSTFERHAPGTWHAIARDLAASGGADGQGAGAGVNANGAPLLGDSRDLFRPKTSDIPARPGVYKWRDGEGRVIYVGKAKNLRNRLTNYFQPLRQLHPRTQTMVLTARSLEWTVVGTEIEALTLEYTWIKEFDPRFNVVFRDDKTYPYLAISAGEEYPRVWVTRSRKRRDTRYFGPYAKVWDLRKSLDRLLRAFPVRTCTPSVFRKAQLTGRPCLLASIGKCSAPCVGRITPKEHRRMCEQLVGVLTGRIGRSYVAQLTAQMKEASAELDFERAARLRDDIQMLSGVVEQNSVVLDQDVDADVFGFAADELEASVHAFFVRAGTIRGERNWSVERSEGIGDDE
ncbi:MAG: excinuclease ABC subunit UvrC, partial [Bifidobacterium castoris]|nr:excinuclease ABC subunit UvrC [Bifidobacterium castoris]